MIQPLLLPQIKPIKPLQNLSKTSKKRKKGKLTPLHKTQKQVFRSPHRYRVVVCGRRWGKSRLALATGILAAMGKLPDHDGGILTFPYDPASPPTVVFAMPTLKQCKKIFWKPLVNLLSGQPFVESINRSEHTIKLVGDLPEIVCVGLNDGDGDRVRGFRIAALLADEWQDVKPGIWDEVLQPAMADTPGSIALFTGTPKGKVNHLYKFDLRSQQFDDWASFRFHTADNPFIPRAEIAKAEATQEPRVFRQEWQASYEDFPGQIFDHLEDRHLRSDIPKVFKRVVMGVDWGDVNPALSVHGKDNQGVWWTLDTWYSSIGVNILDDALLEEGRKFKGKYGVQHIWCGHDRPASIQKWAEELGIPCMSWQDAKPDKDTKAPTVAEGNSKLNSLLYHSKWFIADHLTEFKDKCGSYHREERNGIILDKIADGQDDHEVDSTRYAIVSEEFYKGDIVDELLALYG